MNDEILHRIEHKLDELIGYLRNSSLARQGDRTATEAVSNFIPSLPNEERACPVCTHVVTITNEPKMDNKGTVVGFGLKRNCACKVVTVR